VLERLEGPKQTLTERLVEPPKKALLDRLGEPPTTVGNKRNLSARSEGGTAVEGGVRTVEGPLENETLEDSTEVPQKKTTKYDRVASPDDEVELTPAADSEDEEEGGPSEAEEEGTVGNLSRDKGIRGEQQSTAVLHMTRRYGKADGLESERAQ
jgi:hypothetical protein